ncbi:MAG: FapA family protein [Clostridiales Family XIII bacterium]|nr:FapA family protein [Clostridiales Family XIII bacterium]
MAKYEIRVRVSEDNLEAYVTLTAPQGDEAPEPLSEADILKALEGARVVYGIDKSTVAALASGPIAGTEFLIAMGAAGIDGVDGSIEFHVKNSDEYKPDYGGEEKKLVDYKNVDIFQMVSKGQALCTLTPPTQGVNGTNVYGGPILAKNGKEPRSPKGLNTEWNGDSTSLLSTVDGTVGFKGDVINVMEVLNIPGDVNMSTGNIRFKGDVIVRGSVSEGFSVECGGNLTVRGSIGNAEIRAGGNLIVSEGVNGGRMKKVAVGGFMKCRYIENGSIEVRGDIFSDYIIDSNVSCRGNITLSGGKAVLVGGRTSVLGVLQANYIGNERGIRTRVELMETPVDEERLAELQAAFEKAKEDLRLQTENVNKIRSLMDRADRPELNSLYKQLAAQLPPLREELRIAEAGLKELTADTGERFPGCIVCKRIIYSGADLFAGSLMMARDMSNIEACRLYIDKGDWARAPA